MTVPHSRALVQILAALLLTALFPSASRADALPLWEVGAGVAGIGLPDYRGADESSFHLLPIPYVIYRGERLKADRGGVRSTLFDNERIEASLSINGTLPVRSNNTARRGMRSLKPTIELGPTVNVNLWKSPDDRWNLNLRTPLRTAITIESSPRQIGWLLAPNLNLAIKDVGNRAGWNLSLQTGPLIANREYNAYFYSVGTGEATATRPAYAASGGYAGSQFTATLTKRFPRYWVGTFLRYDNLSGTAFDDSPLLRRRNTLSAGLAVSWIFGESSMLVEADE